MASNMADKGILNYQEQYDDIFDCSDNTIIDKSDSENDLTKLKTEPLALKMFVSEQIYLLKQSVGTPNTSRDNYIKSLEEQIYYLKKENKIKNSIIQSLVHQNTYDYISSQNKNNDKSDNSSCKHSEEVIPPNMSDNSTNKSDDLINRNSNIVRDSQNLNKDVINDDISNGKKSDKTVIKKDKRNITERRKQKSIKSKSKHSDTNINKEVKNNSNKINNDKTSNPKKKVFILGDSMVKKVNSFLLTRNISHKFLVKVRSFSSAKVNCMNDYVKPTLRDFNPEHMILHFGTNDLNSEQTASQIAKSIIDLGKSLKTDTNTITISVIVLRYDNLNNKASEVNGRLVNMCKECNISYIDHVDAISPEHHLNESHSHLNRYPYNRICKEFYKVFI